jgi:uncharacterized protein with FMN-binding domain
MRNFLLIITVLFSLTAISPYYDKDSKYAPEDDAYIPKAQLNVEFKQDRIETYLDSKKAPKRMRPKYEKIE